MLFIGRIFVNAAGSADAAAASASDMISAADVASATDAAAGTGLSTGGIILICLCVFLLLMVALEFIRSRYVLSVTRKTLVLDDLPKDFDGTRIALVSDLHQMRFGDFNEELAKHIRRESPNYIMFAGDMGDSLKYNVDAYYDFVDSLGRDIPLIMVPGNHDLRLGGGAVHKNFVREMEHAGALLLNNSCAELLSGDSKLYVYGFCPPLEPKKDVSVKQWSFAPVGDADIPAMLGRCPSDAPVLLLAHDPQPFSSYSKWGARLILCGHMHGGLVRLPFLGGVFSPNKGKFFPKYSSGLFNNEHSSMYVTRGLGTPLGVRFFNAPEIVILTLVTPDSGLLKEPVADPGESIGEKAKKQTGVAADWAKGEIRSLKALLYERSVQLRDFFGLMFGRKRSRFAKAADEKIKKNTYIAPKKPKSAAPDRTKRKGQFTVKPRDNDYGDDLRDGESFDSHENERLRTDSDKRRPR